MTSYDPVHQTIIGLPTSGKTTFLAALWHLLNAGEVDTALLLDQLIGNHEHLNAIAEAWRRCEEVPRTSMAAEANVAIHIREPLREGRAVLHFPDLSGESFERQVALRTCRLEYLEGFAGDGAGAMLFVTADRPQDGLTVLEVNSMLEAPNDPPAEVLEWTPKLLPQQVQLVELLQFLQRRPFRRARRRLAVIVSAWDVVSAPRPTPGEWLDRELPLLSQFLASNQESFESRIWGVSALGGDIRTDARAVLLTRTPSDRIECIGYDTLPHDLTGPIRWLLAKA